MDVARPPESSDFEDHDSLAAARISRVLGEVVLLSTTTISPWLFGCASPGHELLPAISLLALLGLWAFSGAVQGRIRLRIDIVTVTLAGLVVITALQLVPMPESIASIVMPTRLAQHREFQPAIAESLMGEPGEPRSTMLTLSVDPSATRKFLARIFGVLLLYVVVRNWLATRSNLPRFALVAAINGGVLAFVALVHRFSESSDTILWLMPVGSGSAFGPFVCRNHYPDYVNFCLGAGLGWLMSSVRTELQQSQHTGTASSSARLYAMTFGLIVMAASLPFSLSRGGIVSTLLAAGAVWILSRLRRKEEDDAGAGRGLRVGISAAIVAVLVMIAWFGTQVLETRLSTVSGGEVFQSRVPLWTDSAKLLPWTWPLGAGAGSFYTLEPIVRSRNPATTLFYYDSVHNEYLEALIDGGIVRLGLTLLLVGGLLWTVGRGYLERGGRTIGPYLLGFGFGATALVFHSATDFGIRMPAVAFLATTCAAFAMAAAGDTSFAPARVRVRKTRSRSDDATMTMPVDAPQATAPPQERVERTKIVRGIWAATIPLVLALASVLVVMEVANRAQVRSLHVEAERLFYSSAPDEMEQRARAYAERATLRPYDADVLTEAGLAHIDVATYRTWTTTAAVGGAPLSFVAPPEPIPEGLQKDYLRRGLAYLQQARRVNPLSFKPHARLAVYADYFAKSEPASVHFDRAKKLLPPDPDLWHAAGRDAMKRGNTAAAKADFRRSLSLSPLHLSAILEAFRATLSPEQLRAELVPDDVRNQWVAVQYLYPDPDRDAVLRQPYLAAIRQAIEPRVDETSGIELSILANVYDELDRADDASAVWTRLLEREPNKPELKDRYAARLEVMEQYEEAVPLLESLRRTLPGRPDLQDRLDAARRGLRLQTEIRLP